MVLTTTRLVESGSRYATAVKRVIPDVGHDAGHIRLTVGALLCCPQVDVGSRADGGHHFVNQLAQARVGSALLPRAFNCCRCVHE